MPRIVSLSLPLITAVAVLTSPPVCTAFSSSRSSTSCVSQLNNNNPKESDINNIASVNVNTTLSNDAITELLPQLYTYQKPRQKRTPQTTLTRPRKPRFYWHDEENIQKELQSFWDELHVPIHKFYPDNPAPPIPSEFLLNHFKRNDLRWGIAQFGGRDSLSHALNGAVIIPGKWKEAKELEIIQSLLHLIDSDGGGDSRCSTRRNSETRRNTAINTNNPKQPLVELVVSSSTNTTTTAASKKPRKEFWSKEKAIRNLYSYLDNYKKYKSRPSVWMPQLSELNYEGYARLFNACSRFKKLPHGAAFATMHSQQLLEGNASVDCMAGLVPFKEWRFFESQLQLFVELRHYLNLHHNGSQDIFPDPKDVKLNGHEELSILIRSHGGKQLLAQKLDMELISTISIQSWGPFSLDFAIELLQFIRERYVAMSPPLPYPVISMPSERDLKRYGCEELCHKVDTFGGYENVARRLGLSFFDVCKQQQLDEQMIRGAKKLWKDILNVAASFFFEKSKRIARGIFATLSFFDNTPRRHRRTVPTIAKLISSINMVNVKKDSIEGRLIRVAEKVLVEEYTQRLSQDNFTWDQEVSSNIVKAYRTEYGVISPSDMKIINGTMDKKQWRWNQTGKARTKSKIGIVRPLTGGALAGEISATGRESALGTATRNAQKGQGPEMSIDLSLVDLGLMTKYLQQLQAHQEPDALPPHLMKFLMKDSDANDLRAVVANQFENVQEYLLDASGNNMNMSAADVLQPKHITDGKIDNLVKLINYGKDCANPESAREEGANLRKFGIATIREIMLGEECLLGSGKVVLLPMIVTLSTGKVLKFPALATMGFENESGDVLLDRMICPGMSNNHYESQSDNVQPILLDGYSIFVPSLGMHFHTNALSNSSGRIKLAEDRDSGEFGTVPVPVNGSDRLFKKLYPTAEEVGNTVKYKRHTISLPILERSKRPVRSAKATKSEKAVFRKVAHHRLNNLITDHIGTRGKDEELNALLKAEKVSCLEALLLATGESQVDYEEMLRKFNLTQEEVDSWEENVVREKVPQGQCDNDHFCHRNHPICNSHYAALPTSHTANTINSIIRRMNGDWCYGMSIHPYKDGS